MSMGHMLPRMTVVRSAMRVALKVTLIAKPRDRPWMAIKALIHGCVHVAKGTEATLFLYILNKRDLTVSVHLLTTICFYRLIV